MPVREAVAALAVVPFTMAVVVIALGVVRMPSARRAGPAELVAAIGLALEFLLAAGLLRLASVETYAGLAAVAAIVVLRKIIRAGLASGLRALGAARYVRIRA